MTENFFPDIPPDLLTALLENPYESMILVDKDGMVRFLSPANEEFYKTTIDRIKGRHILELNPQSELQRVIHTGRAEIGRLIKLQGRDHIIARIPLKDSEGMVIGAVAKLMFVQPQNIRQLMRQVEVLESRLDYYQKELKSLYSKHYTFDNIAGEAKPMQEAKRVAIQAARSDLTVLITGETGTGKEIFANAIHQMSDRRDNPLVRVNCSSIPHELIESELFGYESGAFTGAARQGKPGKFELADKGTIFLDEVGDMPMVMQAKLLRVIQEFEVDRLGGLKPIKLDFRVIAATNQDLQARIREGKFRQDLFYRLNIFHLKTPALRTIREDIPRICYHLLSKFHEGKLSAPKRISPEAMSLLVHYDWSGNVRELQNVLQRAVSISRDRTLYVDHLPMEIQDRLPREQEPRHLPGKLKDEMAIAERQIVERALRITQGNRGQAAQLLGIHRTGLYQKMKRYGLQDYE
ncbi:MAG: AAA family ATPase [Deltaproteobacteria bacterium]|nr:AAA family ATPase [Deltaproteobacteria bacterium]